MRWIIKRRDGKFLAYDIRETGGGTTNLFMSEPVEDTNVVPLSWQDKRTAIDFLERERPGQYREYKVVKHRLWGTE